MNPNYPENMAETESSFSIKDVFTLLRFVINAMFRHKIIVIVCLISITVATYFLIKIIPRTYQTSSRIMTVSSTTISQLAKTGRYGSQSTTNGVTEIMKSRKNLVGIIEELNLSKTWSKTRPPFNAWMDGIMSSLFGPPTDEDVKEALVSILSNRLAVWVENDVVIIQVEWHDPKTAFEIQQVVIDRFFEERRSQELAEIRETVRLLEKKYENARSELEEIATKNEKLTLKATEMMEEEEEASRGSTAPTRSYVRSGRLTAGSESEDEELAQVTEELQSVRDEMAQLKATHKRQLDSERQKLAQFETAYGPLHPDIIKSKKYIELLSAQNPVPVELVHKERKLATLEEKLKLQKEDASARPISRRRLTVQPQPEKTPAPEDDKDKADLLIQSRLASDEYRQVEMNLRAIGQTLSNARMELEATEAAFNYRYRLTQPPLLPKKPIKPQGMKIMLGAIPLSLFLGVFLAVFADIRSGLILEIWQVEKVLDVPLLGQMDDSTPDR